MPAPAGKVLTRYSFSMQIILKNSLNNTFLTLEFDPINNWYFANWIGYASPENVKEGALKYLELMKEKPSAFLLNNNQELVGPWDKANDWLENIWIPQARELGLKYMAHILAPNIAAALSSQDLHRRVDGHFEMRIFGEMEKGKAWLRQNQAAEPDLIKTI